MNNPLIQFCSPVQSHTQRVPGHILSHLLSSTMQSHYYLAFTFICILPFLSAALSIQCTESQYAWPRSEPTQCCNSCPPGNRMQKRSEDSCDIECDSCLPDQYMDKYNLQYDCKFCRTCEKSNIEYESHCNSTHDAVCRCKAGYRCKDQPCTECEEIPATTIHALTSTLATTVSSPTKSPPFFQDTMWLLATVVLLCVFAAFFVVAKIHHLQHWIRHKFGNILEKKTAPVSASSEDEEVSKPIQEVCGKCDQLFDV